jgi:hypothetical protein
MDFSTIRFRASSWGNLLTEPRTKGEGALSITCQKELLKIYSQEVYGRKKDITTKQMDKGVQVEDSSIILFSKVTGEFYFKNDERLQNEWFTGHPDIFKGDNILNCDELYDIKSSWELDSFLPKLLEAPDKGYVAQLNAYYSLTGANSGGIVYCLVSAPLNILESEKKSLLWKMNVATEYAPEYLQAVGELEKLMMFEDIPEKERCIVIPVERDEELIQKMKDKVPVMRQWLQDFHTKHISHHNK